MKLLLTIIMLLTLSSCMMPVVKQPPTNIPTHKYRKNIHHAVRQHNHKSDNSSQNGVPVVNLMGHQGGQDA